MHKTNNLDDGYFGSGLNIKRAITKYGLDNFKKEYIAIFDNPNDMYTMESELVNDTLLNSGNAYNIVNGGHGGWTHINDKLDKNIRHQIAVKGGTNSAKQSPVPHEEMRRRFLLIPLEKRIEFSRKVGKTYGFKGDDKLSDSEVKKRLSLIKDIDLMRYGWVTMVSKILGISHSQVRRFINKYYMGNYYRRSLAVSARPSKS